MSTWPLLLILCRLLPCQYFPVIADSCMAIFAFIIDTRIKGWTDVIFVIKGLWRVTAGSLCRPATCHQYWSAVKTKCCWCELVCCWWTARDWLTGAWCELPIAILCRKPEQFSLRKPKVIQLTITFVFSFLYMYVKCYKIKYFR